MSKIRILIVEDDPIICEDIREMVSNADYDAIAVAHTKTEAINCIDKLLPDLVLLDINLEGNHEGIDIANYINKKYKIPFLYLTSYSGKEILDKAKKTTPMGYVIKPFNEKELYTAIEIGLYNFSKFMLPVSLNRGVINSLIKTSLTKKEFETLKGLYEGKTNKVLAEDQFVSINTIKTHVKNIYEKMNTHTRLETITLVKELLQ